MLLNCSMTTAPEEKGRSPQQDSAPWKLPPEIWHPEVRRACLEAAERAWSEGYEEGRGQGIVLRLLYWRGIEVPGLVRERVHATTDLEQLRIMRDRAYEVTDAADLFSTDEPA
jgi:hypothetical protein